MYLPRVRRLALFLLVLAAFAVAQLSGARRAGAPTVSPFSDIGAGLTGVNFSSSAWGDYDSDGDLDILITGNAGTYSSPDVVSRIYRNDGSGVFTPISAGLTGVLNSSVAWGDYDSDGDLDILLTGTTGVEPSSDVVSKIYRNNGSGNFTDIGAGLTGVDYSSVAWGDYDSDGDLDILLTGHSDAGYITKLYENSGSGSFSENTVADGGLIHVGYSSVAWGDCDGDGRLDILLTGTTGGSFVSKIYHNDGGSFSDFSAGLTDLGSGSAAWGDYDSDGDLDVLLAGSTGDGSTHTSKVFRNDGVGGFADIGAVMATPSYGSSIWGDSDSDGDLDILLTGVLVPSGYAGEVYRNDGSDTFTSVAAGLTPVGYSSAAWGDYDSDGKLDVLLTGYDDYSGIAKIYRNVYAAVNARPSTPSGLDSSVVGAKKAVLSWNASSDSTTPTAGLTYNLRVGTTPGGSDVVSAMASSDGFRRVPALGNVGERTTYTLNHLPHGTYYWSVQAIDNNFAGSAFAAEQSFTVPPTFVFSSASYSIGEAGPSASITIKRYSATEGTDSVHFATANGTATASSDYTAVSQDVSFSHDQSEKTVSVPITNDTQVEGNETVLLSLTNPSTATAVGSPSSATLTIIDNDRTFAFSAAGYSVGERAGAARITIVRSGLTTGTDTVQFVTTNGSARAGRDYAAVSQTVSFAAGETQKTVSVSIKNDKLYEKNETVKLSLASPSTGATLASPSSATLTIRDDDPLGKLESAKLSEKSFHAFQAKKVKLTCKFSPKSRIFKWVISLKHGKKWQAVKSATKRGSFSKKTMTVKALFSGKKMKKGTYKLRLSADRNSKTLRFAIK